MLRFHVRVCVWKFPSWEIMWNCLHVCVCVCVLALASASAFESQSCHVAIRCVWKLRCTHTPGVQLGMQTQMHTQMRTWRRSLFPPHHTLKFGDVSVWVTWQKRIVRWLDSRAFASNFALSRSRYGAYAADDGCGESMSCIPQIYICEWKVKFWSKITPNMTKQRPSMTVNYSVP